MSFPTIGVDVSWSTGPLDTPSWESIAGDVKSISTRSGRSAQFGGYEPGRATFRLNNRARTYDPLHAAGDHFGDLKPNKRMRVRATWDGTTYDVFTGFADGWPQDYSAPSEAVSTVKATDGFKLLARKRMPADLYADEVLADSPRLWYRMDETSGRRLLDSSGNERHAYTQTDMSTVTADGLLPCSTNGGITLDSVQWDARIPKEHLAFDYDPCTIEFWFRANKPPSAGVFGYICSAASEGGIYPNIYLTYEDPGLSVGGLVTFGLIDGVALRLVAGSTSITDGLPHHVVFTRSGSTRKVYIDGVDVTRSPFSTGSFTSTVGASLDLNVNYDSGNYEKWEGAQSPQLDEFAIYDTAISSTRVAAHYQAGVYLWDGDRTGERLVNVLDAVDWPAADRDIDTGQAILGPASWDKDTSALDLGRLLEATEQGALFIDHRDGGKLRFRGRNAVLADTVSTTSQATFTDEAADTTNVHYSGIEIDYDDTEIINSVTVNWVGGDVTVQDATSIGDGEQSITVDTLLRTRAEAEGLANWILAHTKDPRVRIRSITIKATGWNGTAEDAIWQQVLGRKFGDRITVIRHPQGVGDPIETDVIIDGIDHDIANGVETWTTTFRCSPAETVDYWVLGTSELGTDTRLAA